LPAQPAVGSVPFSFVEALPCIIGFATYFAGILFAVLRLVLVSFTDVGTTYKLVGRKSLVRLLSQLNPEVNLEFNAHFMDIALARGVRMVECPITFHPRVGVSKGGNVNNGRALTVGLQMLWGLCFGWR
jgi:hypothetical protein